MASRNLFNGRVLQLTTEETAAGYLMNALAIPTLLAGIERLSTLPTGGD